MTARDYADREKIEHDEVSLPLCRRLAALLDLDPEALTERDELPLAWSSILFASVARQSEIGPDGHPRRGDFLPDITLPRRRFAGRQVTLHRPLVIGDRVTRRSTIAEVAEKEGRSGPLVFVTILHEIASAAGPAYSERQNLVYLGADAGGGRTTEPEVAARPAPDWSETARFDPVMLFRYSALTYNGHRIHYDKDYATSAEGYPGLVVNGGITTLYLLELARRNLPGRITGYKMRARSVLPADTVVRLEGSRTAAGAAMLAIGADGRTAVQVDVAVD